MNKGTCSFEARCGELFRSACPLDKNAVPSASNCGFILAVQTERGKVAEAFLAILKEKGELRYSDPAYVAVKSFVMFLTESELGEAEGVALSRYTEFKKAADGAQVQAQDGPLETTRRKRTYTSFVR